MSTTTLIKRILIIVVVVGLAAVLGTTVGQRLAAERQDEHGSHEPGAQLQAGKVLPEHTLHDVDGTEVELRPLLRGRKTVLFFFSTECDPCLNYIDDWDEWLRASDVDYDFFGVSADHASKLLGFVDMYEPAFRILNDRGGQFATQYEMATLPVIIGVDADGVISFVEIGYRRDKHIEIDYWLRDG